LRVSYNDNATHSELETTLYRFLCITILALSLPGAVAFCGENAKPHFQISMFNLGITGGSIEADAVATQIASGDWCTATAAPQAQRWNKRPEKVAASEWVSVVLTGFGAQANAFVFIFDEPGDSPRMLAHVPYTLSWTPGGGKKWIPPVSQISETFRVNYRRAPPATPVPRVSIKLGDWQGGAAKELGDAAAPTASISKREALPPMEVMLCAALCENGWAPTWGQSEQNLGLELRLEFKAASMRFTKQTGNASTVRKKEAIPEDYYYPFLKRLIYLMKSNTGIADFALPAGGRFRLMNATTKQISGVGENGIVAFDPQSAKRLWPAALPPNSDSYAMRLDDAGIAKVFRFSRGVAAVDLASGAQKVLSAEAPGSPWNFAVRDDGTAIVARGTTLSAQRNGAEIWRKEESSNVSAGPLILSSLVFAGTDTGDLICKNIDDGTEKWRKTPGGELRGYLSGSGEMVIAYTNLDDALLAVSVNDGTTIWKQSVGDVLLKAPVKVGSLWLVAGKNNRIMLLNSADGKVAADVRWPTWLVDVVSATVDGKSVIICTDIGGRLSILDSANLKTIREFKLPSRPNGELMYAPQFPSAWGTAVPDADKTDLLIDEVDVKSIPAILVTDDEGFLYIVHTK
jgi:outer membrane protein assembly factor BamB